MRKPVFVRHRHDRHGAGAAAARIGADANLHLLPGRGLEEAVDVVRRGEVAAVHREQILAGDDVDAGLRQRRGRLRIPVLAVVDPREAVAAVLDLVVAAEQAGLHALDVGRVAAADAQMSDHQIAEHFGEQIVEIGARTDPLEER